MALRRFNESATPINGLSGLERFDKIRDDLEQLIKLKDSKTICLYLKEMESKDRGCMRTALVTLKYNRFTEDIEKAWQSLVKVLKQ